MIRFRSTLAILFLSPFLTLQLHAQSPSPAAETSSESTELLTLSRKIDAQNAKIDLLSQQIANEIDKNPEAKTKYKKAIENDIAKEKALIRSKLAM